MAVDRAGLPSSGCEALINGALEAEAPGSLQTRLTAAAIPLLRSPQCSPALALDAISCLVCPAADQRLNSALLLWYSGLRRPPAPASAKNSMIVARWAMITTRAKLVGLVAPDRFPSAPTSGWPIPKTNSLMRSARCEPELLHSGWPSRAFGPWGRWLAAHRWISHRMVSSRGEGQTDLDNHPC